MESCKAWNNVKANEGICLSQGLSVYQNHFSPIYLSIYHFSSNYMFILLSVQICINLLIFVLCNFPSILPAVVVPSSLLYLWRYHMLSVQTQLNTTVIRQTSCIYDCTICWDMLVYTYTIMSSKWHQ